MSDDKFLIWEMNVGKFILRTGEVELHLLQLYWNISLDGSYDEKVKTDSFSKKINRIRNKVNDSGIRKPLKEKVLQTLSKCSDLVVVRNLVAHNPLSMDIYFDRDGSQSYEPLIRSLRNDEVHLTEKQLLKAIDDTQKVILEFSIILPDSGLWSWREHNQKRF